MFLVGLLLLASGLYLPIRAAPWVYEDANWLPSVATSATRSLTIPSRTLTTQTYHWTWEAVGREPALYRVTNLVLHLIAGVLVYGVLAQIVAGGAPLVAAGIFLLHPLTSTVPSYVSARPDAMMTVFVLLAVWLSLQPLRAWRWILIGLALTGAAMSKEIGLIGIPLVLLTILIWRRPLVRQVLCAPLWIALGALLGALWPAIRTWMDLNPHLGGSWFSWPDFAVLQVTAAWHILSSLVTLQGFSIDRDTIGLSQTWTVGAVCMTATAVIAILLYWRRAPLVTWASAWFLVALLPRVLFRTNELLTEPQMYLAVIGPIALISVGATRLWEWRSRPGHTSHFLAIFLVLWSQSGLAQRRPV